MSSIVLPLRVPHASPLKYAASALSNNEQPTQPESEIDIDHDIDIDIEFDNRNGDLGPGGPEVLCIFQDLCTFQDLRP